MGPTFSSLTMAAPLGSGGRKNWIWNLHTAYHVGLVVQKLEQGLRKRQRNHTSLPPNSLLNTTWNLDIYIYILETNQQTTGAAITNNPPPCWPVSIFPAECGFASCRWLLQPANHGQPVVSWLMRPWIWVSPHGVSRRKPMELSVWDEVYIHDINKYIYNTIYIYIWLWLYDSY